MSDTNQTAATPMPPQTPPANQQAPATDSPQALTTPQDSSAPAQPTPAQPTAAQPEMASNQGAMAPQAPVVPKGVDPDNPNAYHPAVQKAAVLHTVAEALAGSGRTRTTIDPNTGETTRTKVPLTTGQIGMAIALSAIQGALTGFSVPNGPGNLGRAAGAAGAQAIDQQAQAKQAQEQQASADYARQYQTLKANLQMRNLAIQTGKMDLDSHQALVGNSAQQLALLKDSSPESIAAQNVSEQEAQDIHQYPVTDYYRLPDGAVPRLDAGGQPVYTNGAGRIVDKDAPGAMPSYDNTYSIIHRDAKIPAATADGQPADWVKQATDWGLLPSNWLKATPSATVPASVAASFSHQVTTLQQTQGDLDHFYGTLGQSNPVDLHAAVKADPSLAKAVEKFSPLLAASNHSYGVALAELQKVNQQYAGQIAQLYGGQQNIKLMDQKTAHVDTENGYRTNGIPDDKTAQQILSAPKGSFSQDVVDAATAFQQNQVSQAGAKAGAEERAKLPGELALKRAGQEAGSSDTVQQLAESIASGNGTLDTISDRKTKAAVESYLSVHHPNLDRNSVTLTPDARKKAQLAGSVNLNLGIIQDVLNRRPDLVGPVDSMLTRGENFTGNNDKDLARLGVALDNYGQAAVGIHGSRSYQNKEQAAHQLLNGYKNGQQAGLAAVDAARQSASVFANAGKPRGMDGSAYVVLPKPQAGQIIDATTVQKYLQKYGSPQAARVAAQRDGWALPAAQGAK